jgi:hypothetical protein
MIRRITLAAALALGLAAPALAGQCPMDMSKIDAALAEKGSQLSAADKEKVTQLRAQGEAQHKAGQHSESVATLAQAKEILGIQ